MSGLVTPEQVEALVVAASVVDDAPYQTLRERRDDSLWAVLFEAKRLVLSAKLTRRKTIETARLELLASAVEDHAAADSAFKRALDAGAHASAPAPILSD